MIMLSEITDYCNRLLAADTFNDYCPNGLQVQGADSIHRIVTGVTASLALIEAAVRKDAQLILVHHGYFWKGESPVLTGMKYRRLHALISKNIGLLAYHLPLDAHPEYGNNAQIGRHLQLTGVSQMCADGIEGLFWHGELVQPATTDSLAEKLTSVFARAPLAIGAADKKIRRLAWCSGGAQHLIDKAADLGCDAFISGEISEQTTHIARERDIVYFAAGHHATERFGVQSLGAHLADKFSVDVEFIDIDNPA